MLERVKTKPAGMMTAMVGPGQKMYHFSHAFTTKSTSSVFHKASKHLVVGESIPLHLPNLNALDFEEYISYLTTGACPLAPVTLSTIPKEFVAYESLIRLFNIGFELGDARFQNACVDEALERYGKWGIFPAEQVLRELLQGTGMWRLMIDVYRTGWQVERFRHMRGKVPMDFLWAVMEGFMEARDEVEVGAGLEDACVYHLHDRLWPKSSCGRGVIGREGMGKYKEQRGTDSVPDWIQGVFDLNPTKQGNGFTGSATISYLPLKSHGPRSPDAKHNDGQLEKERETKRPFLRYTRPKQLARSEAEGDSLQQQQQNLQNDGFKDSRRKPLQPEDRMSDYFKDYNGVEVTGARYEIPEVEARIHKVKGKMRLQPACTTPNLSICSKHLSSART